MRSFEIKKSFNTEEIHDMFKKADRGDNFTTQGLETVLEYLDEFGTIKLDVIDICCGFSEYSFYDLTGIFIQERNDAMNDFDNDLTEYETEINEAFIENIRKSNQLLEVSQFNRYILVE